jgi:hypothetical protein
VHRPLADPVAVRALALASDAPEELGAVLLGAAAPDGRARPGGLAAFGGLELAGAAHHAPQPVRAARALRSRP